MEVAIEREKYFILGILAVVMSFAVGSFWLIYSKPLSETNIVIYRAPDDPECAAWVDHLRKNGYSVDIIVHHEIDYIRRSFYVLPDVQSDHIAVIGDYVIEGHVPAADIKRLLLSRPDAIGLAVPGTPLGLADRMPDDAEKHFQVFLFGERFRQVFSSY